MEGPAIGDARKRAGNELWVIRVAEAHKDLIVGIGVEIPAGIEGVFVLEQLGAVHVSVARLGRRIEVQQRHGI